MSSSIVRRLVPLLDRVIIKRVKAQEKTATGILIPEKAQETVNEGVVEAVGPGAIHPQTGNRIAPALKVGDAVVLPAYGGNTVKVGSEELLVFRESDILAKLEK